MSNFIYKNPLGGIQVETPWTVTSLESTYGVNYSVYNIGGYMEVSPLKWNYEDVGTPYIDDCSECCEDRYDCHDVNGDGVLDLTLKFDTQEIVTNLLYDSSKGDVLCLIITGYTFDDEPFFGQDVIWIR